MGYQKEFAAYNSVKRMAQNERVRELLARCKLAAPPPPLLPAGEGGKGSETYKIVRRAELVAGAHPLPEYVLAIDGSFVEVAVDSLFPAARVGYLTVTDVLLQLEKLRELDRARPVDPRLFRQTHTAGAADTILAGCNIVLSGEIDSQSSLRRGIAEFFAAQRAFDDGENLLATYEALLAYKPVVPQQACPYAPHNCLHETPQQAFERFSGSRPCACPARLPWHSTDALRLYERFNPVGENGTAFGEVMHVAERLWLVHVLRSMEAKGYLSALARLAVVLDGPLAVFGRPGWLSRAIMAELFRLNARLLAITGRSLLVIGVEKSGVFADYFTRLCAESDAGKSPIKIPKEAALLPTDDYIRRRVVFSVNTHAYGDVTYFGRKLFYRTETGACLIATLPFLADNHRDLSTALIEQFPRLADALNLFEALVSTRYPNALAAVSLAHSEAAIPLRLGRRVLETLAREIIK